MEQFEVNRPGSLEGDTITAVSTPSGTGGIAVIRISGPRAIEIADTAWRGKPLDEAGSHTAHLGKYYNTEGVMLDECLATVFRAPRTFTGEDVVEIAVHGSRWIQREVLSDLIRRGARVADAGEFTRRAFLNGRIDLAQAEGIADLIAASSKAAHSLAVSQTRGRFSRALEELRERLIEFASLLELELDFSEEDVEFADRERMLALSREILRKVERLGASYSSGAVLKEGVPVVIAGVPNAGKSSLLNLLLNDDKAIVSDIPGTTRDTIEDTIEIDGILYRFIDTAGLRESEDTVEAIGIERARERMRKAHIVVWLIDPTTAIGPQQMEIGRFRRENPETALIVLANKMDLRPEASAALEVRDSSGALEALSLFSSVERESEIVANTEDEPAISEDGKGEETDTSCHVVENLLLSEEGERLAPIPFSTKTGEGLDSLKESLSRFAKGNHDPENEIMVTNARHYESLVKGGEALRRAIDGIETGLSGDFIAQDVREALHHLGTITGSITTPTLLESIFSRFCIGK